MIFERWLAAIRRSEARLVVLLLASLCVVQCVVQCVALPWPAREVPPKPDFTQQYVVSGQETLDDTAVGKGLGYLELVAVNPDVSPNHLAVGEALTLPIRHLRPSTVSPGVVTNLGDLRLYYSDAEANTMSWPIGIGRQGKDTPLGRYAVTQKRVDPV